MDLDKESWAFRSWLEQKPFCSRLHVWEAPSLPHNWLFFKYLKMPWLSHIWILFQSNCTIIFFFLFSQLIIKFPSPAHISRKSIFCPLQFSLTLNYPTTLGIYSGSRGDLCFQGKNWKILSVHWEDPVLDGF